MDTPDYREIFRQTSSLLMLLSPDKRILDASNAYLKATLQTRESVEGKGLFEVFPDDPNQPESSGVRNLNQSLDYVLTNKNPHIMDLQKYDVPKGDGTFELRYWLPRNMPIFDNDGQHMTCILHQAENVTDFILLQQKQSKQTVQLNEAESQVYLRSQALQKQTIELERVNIELAKSRDEALEASRLKSSLIANVSHELRTPLSSILGYSELLQSGTPLDEEQKKKINVIQSSAQMLLVIVNDLLDTSRIEANELNLIEAPMKLRPMVEEIIGVIKPSADDKGLALTVTINDTVPDEFIADANRLRQILYIFLSNGVKFTNMGGVTLNVTWNKEISTINFSVIDTGIGISEEVKKKLFTPFYQADVSNTRRYGGAGLGLNIAKKLVELMKGEIGFESTIQKGSTFWVQIPLKEVKKEAETTTSASTETGNIQNARILVVDDNKVIQNLVKHQLKALKVKTVDFAENGQEGVEKVIENSYDIILMDLQMPVMDGYSATRAIREFETKTQQTHRVIIAMTASIMQEEKNRAYSAGMNDVLGKPFKLEGLKNILTKWM